MSDRLFDMTGRVAIITGGAGFLGRKHAEVIARAGGIPVLAESPVRTRKRPPGNLPNTTGARHWDG